MTRSKFWEAIAGCWAGEGSYFGGDMQPICAAYGVVMQITIGSDRTLTWHEWKQYPPGELARSAAAGSVAIEEGGYEKASLLLGRIMEDDALDLGRLGRFRSIDGHSALRDLLDPESGMPRYRTWHTLLGPNVLATAQYGIHFTAFEADYRNRPIIDRTSGIARPNPNLGQIKGFSQFRYQRIAQGDIDSARAERRARFEVMRSADQA